MCRPGGLAGTIKVREQDEPKSPPIANKDDELPYAVELWDETRSDIEKILARAFKMSLARAIFRAALEENPGRKVTLRHAGRVVEDNGDL
jgi:hypothetical protein